MNKPLDPTPMVGPLGARYGLYDEWWMPAYWNRKFDPRPEYEQDRDKYGD